MARFNLGWASLTAGELERARRELEDALARFTADGWDYGITRSLTALAAVALHAGSDERASALLQRSLGLAHRLRDLEDGVWALELHGVALSSTTPDEAACFLGAAEAGRRQLGILDDGIDAELHVAALERLRRTLGDDGLARSWERGRRLGLERTLESAAPAEAR